MAETIRKVEYFYVQAPNKPGVGASLLAEMKNAGVNLVAFSGFPSGRGAQIDFVPENPAAFRPPPARRSGRSSAPSELSWSRGTTVGERWPI